MKARAQDPGESLVHWLLLDVDLFAVVIAERLQPEVQQPKTKQIGQDLDAADVMRQAHVEDELEDDLAEHHHEERMLRLLAPCAEGLHYHSP